jgi:hypothetical protein
LSALNHPRFRAFSSLPGISVEGSGNGVIPPCIIKISTFDPNVHPPLPQLDALNTMPQLAIFQQLLLSKASVNLGRLTTSIDQPQQNYYDPPIEPVTLTSSLDSFSGEKLKVRNTKFDFSLTSLISSAISRGTRSTVTVKTPLVKTYLLDNSEAWFKKATDLVETRRWIEKQFDRNRAVYMIVGFHTVTDAEISQEVAKAREAEGKVSAPVGLSLNAAGFIIPLGDLLDPSIGGRKQTIAEGRVMFQAPGEQICGLQFLKLRQRWFSSAADQLTLSEVQHWQSLEINKGASEDEDDDDIIAVDLLEPDGLVEWVEVVEDDQTILVPIFQKRENHSNAWVACVSNSV